jgi:hypothetical protein
MQTNRRMWRVVLIVAVVAWVGWGTPPAWAQRARVPQTGQTTCWQLNNGLIDCTDTGQDGDIQAGVAWPTPRFTDRRNGTVRDNLTGLVWLQHADCFLTRPWDHALAAANALASGQCDLTDGRAPGDWHLPNIRELLSLIDYGQFDPALPAGHPFLHVATTATVGGETCYWSSTTIMADAAGGGALPYVVRLQNAIVLHPGLSCRVWPIRGGD